MKRISSWSKQARETLYSVLVYVFCTIGLASSLYLSSSGIGVDFENDSITFSWQVWLFFGIAYISTGIFNFIISFREKTKKLRYVRRINAGIFALCGILSLIFLKNIICILVLSYIYLSCFVLYAIIHLIDHHKIREIVRSVIQLFLLFLLFIMIMALNEIGSVIIIGIVNAGICLYAIIYESFSKIHLKTLLNILRKTFAFEILLGLVSLIISFSFVFHINEGLSYGDALWYCFALVTTIGFGDVTVASPLSRVLSVLLGIYGIILVALITSIIVNFYNETKDVSDKKSKPKQEETKSEEQTEEE